MSIYKDPIQLIKFELLTCFSSCKKAHDFALVDENPSQTSATVYANVALSHVACAKSIYACDFEHLENDMIELLFHQVEVFCYELIANVTTNHSHQWTNLEFNKLEELFTESGYWSNL